METAPLCMPKSQNLRDLEKMIVLRRNGLMTREGDLWTRVWRWNVNPESPVFTLKVLVSVHKVR